MIFVDCKSHTPPASVVYRLRLTSIGRSGSRRSRWVCIGRSRRGRSWLTRLQRQRTFVIASVSVGEDARDCISGSEWGWSLWLSECDDISVVPRSFIVLGRNDHEMSGNYACSASTCMEHIKILCDASRSHKTPMWEQYPGTFPCSPIGVFREEQYKWHGSIFPGSCVGNMVVRGGWKLSEKSLG